MANKRKTLLLLDGNAIVHRAYHAIPPLSTTDGVQTNAVFGFTSTLLMVLEKFQPDYIIAAFDVSRENFRHEMFADYKATRKETPDDLVPQFDLVKDVVRALGIAIVEKEGYEADDIIGTIAAQASKDGVETIIVTGDKDTLQLVDEHTRVFTMSRGIHDMVLYDADLVKEKMGVRVAQIPDYKGLRGDSSDNIPGVKGIGEKTAVALLSDFDNLDAIYAHLDDIKESVRKKLVSGKDDAYLSKKLGIIKTDVPIKPIDYEKIRTDHMTFRKARDVFSELGFTSLIKRLPDNQEKSQKDEDIAVITVAPKNVATVINGYKNKEVAIALDCDDGTLYGIACADGTAVSFLPFTPKTREILITFLTSDKSAKIVFDAKEMMHTLDQEGVVLAGVANDVLLQAYVVQQNNKLDFTSLVFDVCGVVLGEKKEKQQLSLALRDEEGAQHTASLRAYYTHLLARHFDKKLDATVKTQKKDANIRFVLSTIEMPLISILFAMEKKGVLLDQEKFHLIAKDIDARLADLSQAIYNEAGEEFNINSTQQLRVILFEKLHIDTKDIKKTKTGFSTASSELEKLRDVHPIVEKIEQYRELFKLKTTYIDVLPTLIDDDGRIHTTFNQAVTATGRLSSSDPNLQNIPIRTKEGRKMRDGFVACKGYKLLSADYSQIDLRCVAHVSGDKEMIRAFQNGADIHTFTAAAVLGVDPQKVTKQQRSSAKELNFGLIYGMGQFGFARAAHISRDEAKEFIEKYFTRFAGVKEYMEKTKKDAQKNGYVETLFGRRRYVPNINAKNFQLRAAAERAAINMPIQGLAADIMKLAMIAVDHHIKKMYRNEEVYAILQVHDEIIFEVKEHIVDNFAKDVVRIMEGVCTLAVPLVIDTAIGDHWGAL